MQNVEFKYCRLKKEKDGIMTSWHIINQGIGNREVTSVTFVNQFCNRTYKEV